MINENLGLETGWALASGNDPIYSVPHQRSTQGLLGVRHCAWPRGESGLSRKESYSDVKTFQNGYAYNKFYYQQIR